MLFDEGSPVLENKLDGLLGSLLGLAGYPLEDGDVIFFRRKELEACFECITEGR